MQSVDIRFGYPLTPDDKTKIEAFFCKRYGGCEFSYTSDPALIGGFVAQVGDEVYDASVASRLDKLKERIVS